MWLIIRKERRVTRYEKEERDIDRKIEKDRGGIKAKDSRHSYRDGNG